MLDDIRWDTDLIRRYDLSGPRYTSYPTAVQFHEGVGPFDMLHALRNSQKADRPLSLYVHIPFCANICYYCACNKVITKDRGRSAPYLARLIHEIEIVSRHLGKDQCVEQLHFGGGTPTFLSPGQLRELMGQLREHLNLVEDDSGDYGIEIDPREADWSTMGLLRELGFNRVSVGVQDFDLEVQQAVNRMQSFDETRANMDAARTLQYRSINIDLIYGLPKQNPDSFARTVEQVIGLQPNCLSVFNYAHLPERFMPQRRINAQDLPSPAQKLEMLQRTIEQLSAAATATSAWTTSPCPTTNWPAPRRTAPCNATSRATPPTAIATWWAWAFRRSARSAISTARTAPTSTTTRTAWTTASWPPAAASTATPTTACAAR